MSRQIRSALTEMGVEFCHITEYPRAGTLGSVLIQLRCNICFVDVATDQEQALTLTGEASTDVPVVALNPRNDADIILRCLRRGAREFLAQTTPEQITGVLQRLGQQRPIATDKKPAKAYCVMPGKPGCGASTLAVSLAVELKRGGAPSVLLVDADSLESSIAFLLKLKSGFHLGDAVRDWKRMDLDLWNRLVVQRSGVAVLLGPEDPVTQVPIDRVTALGLLSFWREHYEAIVVDAPGVGSPGSEFAPACDEVLLVTTNELAALHATRRSVECLEHSAVDRARLKLIVNRYTPAMGLKREDVQTALQVAPYALLENDYQVVQAAVLEGSPVSPMSHFGRSVRELAERLTGQEKAPRKRSSFFELLTRKA
jgi:pilus assembly protein CpaE